MNFDLMVKQAEKEAENQAVWKKLFQGTNEKRRAENSNRLRNNLISFLAKNGLPDAREIEIVMGVHWDDNGEFWNYLSEARIDGLPHTELRTHLQQTFDIITLSDNPFIILD